MKAKRETIFDDVFQQSLNIALRVKGISIEYQRWLWSQGQGRT